jgi:GPH family glycoside/pentoside/hexuronide:cation symporter
VREGLALVGVVLASVAPALLGGAGGEAAGLPRFAAVFAVLLVACAAVTIVYAPAPRRRMDDGGPKLAGMAAPLSDPSFVRLLGVFMANGIASAIPATLVLFFVADVLRAESRQGLFLALYFIAGAAGMPLWVKLSAAIGKTKAWGLAMILAIAAFAWVAALGPGDMLAFALICVLSGLALGADLALPPSLLADVIDRRGAMRASGTYFGLWTLATKMNLALAAGIALPLLGALGYAPGSHEPDALRALTVVYSAVPCVLKLAALGTLHLFARSWRRP